MNDISIVNLYSYCQNNATNDSDGNGAISWSKILSVFNKLGEIIGAFLDDYFSSRADSIAAKYASKVNIYTFSAKEYIFTFFRCLG